MKIRCLHGYFLFKETASGDVARFQNIFSGLSIVPAIDDYFTFEKLFEAPTHVIAGDTYLGAPATETYEGKPWDIMRANGLVYNIGTGLVEPITAVKTRLELKTSINYYVSPGLIQPGSVRDDGLRVTDYAAFFLFDTHRFRYSEVSFG